ncbi:MAG: hypothetical protein ACI97A_002722 [Planctomycetota bacterium]|jgi:hypothetical protein
MTGNVWEWYLDGLFDDGKKKESRGIRSNPWSSSVRIFRSGFGDQAVASRMASRITSSPEYSSDNLGVRPCGLITF